MNDDEKIVRDLLLLLGEPQSVSTRKELRRVGQFLSAHGGEQRMDRILDMVRARADRIDELEVCWQASGSWGAKHKQQREREG